MDIGRIRSELEFERSWRIDELRFLENLEGLISDDDDRRRYRKALVVMLYSHFEGFVKIALLIYMRAINAANLKCEALNDALVASALAPLFNQVMSGAKHSFFRHHLPDDSGLHALARRIDFLSSLPEVFALPARLDDKLVDTGSNLKTIVLKKNLFQLGLDHTLVEPYRLQLDRLVEDRNDLAHGVKKDGPDNNEYLILRASALDIMDTLMGLILTTAASEGYRANPARLFSTLELATA
jgi:hypothetical protein